MMRIVLLGVLLVFFTSFSFADEAALEFEGRYWFADLDADVRVVQSGIGTDFDIKSDLGIEDEDLPQGRILWHTSENSKIRLFYTTADYSASRVLSRSIEFGGRTFSAATQVDSDFELQYFGLGWIWQFINLGDKLKLGSLIEAKGLWADISLNAPAVGVSESEEFFGALPTLGLVLEVSPVKKINFFAEASGIGAGDYGYFIDAEGGVKFTPFKYFCVSAGYRVIDFKVEDDSDFVKAQLKGPFVAATLMF